MNSKSFLELVRQRTSCRSYDHDRQVSDEILDRCLEAARLAPSACNKQPWRFSIVRDAALREKICSRGLLPGIPMPWLRDAPVIIVLCVEKSIITHKLAPLLSGIDYELIDAGIAGEHLVLAASAEGLGTCWIGWFQIRQIKKILKLPRHIKPVSLISVGFPKELSPPRERLDKTEIAFENQYRHD